MREGSEVIKLLWLRAQLVYHRAVRAYYCASKAYWRWRVARSTEESAELKYQMIMDGRVRELIALEEKWEREREAA
jgi:hypothetical protein